MPNQLELIQEAARRGILPPEKQPLYDEAVRRGLLSAPEPKVSNRAEQQLPGVSNLLDMTNPEHAGLATTGITPGTAGIFANLHIQNQVGKGRELDERQRSAIFDVYKHVAGRSDTSNVNNYEQIRQQTREGRGDTVLGRFQNAGLSALGNIGNKAYDTIGVIAPGFANEAGGEYKQFLNADEASRSGKAGNLASEIATIIALRKGGPAAIASLYGAMGFGGVRRESAQLRDQGKQVGLGAELGTATGVGAVEALSGFVTDKIMAGMGSIVKNSAPALQKALASGEKTAIQHYTREGLKVLELSMSEGAEEGITQYVENAIKKKGINPEQALAEGVMESAAAGALIAPFGGVGAHENASGTATTGPEVPKRYAVSQELSDAYLRGHNGEPLGNTKSRVEDQAYEAGSTARQEAEVAKSLESNKAIIESNKQVLDSMKPTPTAESVMQQVGTQPGTTTVTVGDQTATQVASPAPAVKPEIVAPKAPAPTKLNRDLAGGKPRYNYGNVSFEPNFESDVDKALFITSQKKPSKRDADYRKFLTDLGYSDAEIESAGKEVRARLKELATENLDSPGELAIPSITALKPQGDGLTQRVNDALAEGEARMAAEQARPTETVATPKQANLDKATRAEIATELDSADEALSGEAQIAVTQFVGHEPGSHKNEESLGAGIMSEHALEDAYSGTPSSTGKRIRQQLETAFAPIREGLKKRFGNTVRAYRSQGPVKEGAGTRNVLSWTLDPEVADSFAGVERNRNLPDSKIDQLVSEFEKNGEVQWAGHTYKVDPESPEQGAINLFKGDEFITGYGTPGATTEQVLRRELKSLQEEYAATDASNAEKRKNIATADINLDDVVWATNRANQVELMVQNKTGAKTVADLHAANMQAAAQVPSVTRAAAAKTGGVNGTEYKSHLPTLLEEFITPIASRIRDISPRFFGRLMRMEFDTGVARETLKGARQPDAEAITEALGGKDSERYKKADLAAKNGDFDTVLALMDVKHQEKFEAFTDMFQTLRDNMVANGVKIGELDNYWPRYIKDHESFDAEFGDGSGRFDDAWALATKAKGKPLTAEEKVEIANSVIQGYGPRKTGSYGPANARERRLKTLSPEQNNHYVDWLESAFRYIDSATYAAERSKFLGRNASEESLPDTIGQMVQQEVDAGHMDKKQQAELTHLLQTRFTADMTTLSKPARMAKQMMYLVSLGQFRNAINQVLDVATTAATHGIGPTVKGVAATLGLSENDNHIMMESVGLHDHGEEFRDVGKIAKATDKILSLTGFKRLDRLGKESRINSAHAAFTEAASNPDSEAFTRLKRDYGPVLGPEFNQTMQDLRDGKQTENVRYLLFLDVAKVQPINLSQMPERYLKANYGRLGYAMKTFMLNQMDYVRRDMIRKLATPGQRREGLETLGSFVALTALVGIGKEFLQDLLRGKQLTPDSIPDKAVDSLLGVTGLNRYTIEQGWHKSPIDAVQNLLMPPLTPYKNVWQDITSAGDGSGLRSVQNIPVVGDLMYYRFGKGADLELADQKTDYKKKLKELRNAAYLARVAGDNDTARNLLDIYNERRTEIPGGGTDGRKTPLTFLDLAKAPTTEKE